MKIGDKISYSKTFGLLDITTFLQLSNDSNPLHTDEAYASKTRFKERIVPGLLTSSIIGGLITKMFGNGAIYMNQNLNFIKPVFLYDKVTATIEIVKIHESKPIYNLNTYIFSKDIQVIWGNAIIMKS